MLPQVEWVSFTLFGAGGARGRGDGPWETMWPLDYTMVIVMKQTSRRCPQHVLWLI